MSAPRTATTDARSGKRFYSWRSESFWSVTTIINGGLPKPALLPWGVKMVAEGAADLADELPALVAKDREAAISMLKALPWAHRDRAAAIGTSIHAATEAYILGQPMPAWPSIIAPRMRTFERFLSDYNPTYEATEASVFNRAERYAGTLDWIVTIGGRKLLVDTKTSEKGPYPEAALQLAAYRHAEFIGLPDGSESPMPEVDDCAVLKLTDGGYELWKARADKEIFRAFLYVRECFRFVTETSKTVLSPWPASEAATTEARAKAMEE